MLEQHGICICFFQKKGDAVAHMNPAQADKENSSVAVNVNIEKTVLH
jgi:hypothetical protein